MVLACFILNAVGYGFVLIVRLLSQVYADASIIFPLLVAETFAHQASKLTTDKKCD